MGIVNSNNCNNIDDDDDNNHDCIFFGDTNIYQHRTQPYTRYNFKGLNEALLRLRASHLPDHVRSGAVGPVLEAPVPRVQGTCGAWSVRGAGPIMTRSSLTMRLEKNAQGTSKA